MRIWLCSISASAEPTSVRMRCWSPDKRFECPVIPSELVTNVAGSHMPLGDGDLSGIAHPGCAEHDSVDNTITA
jgi:hypothetical protein